MPKYHYHLDVILLFCCANKSACFSIARVNQEKDVCSQPFENKKKIPTKKHDLILLQKAMLESAVLAQQRSGTRTTSPKLRGNIKENTMMAELILSHGMTDTLPKSNSFSLHMVQTSMTRTTSRYVNTTKPYYIGKCNTSRYSESLYVLQTELLSHSWEKSLVHCSYTTY